MWTVSQSNFPLQLFQYNVTDTVRAGGLWDSRFSQQHSADSWGNFVNLCSPWEVLLSCLILPKTGCWLMLRPDYCASILNNHGSYGQTTQWSLCELLTKWEVEKLPFGDESLKCGFWPLLFFSHRRLIRKKWPNLTLCLNASISMPWDILLGINPNMCVSPLFPFSSI